MTDALTIAGGLAIFVAAYAVLWTVGAALSYEFFRLSFRRAGADVSVASQMAYNGATTWPRSMSLYLVLTVDGAVRSLVSKLP